MFGIGNSSSSSKTFVTDKSDQSVDNSIIDSSLNGDAENVYNFSHMMGGGGGGGSLLRPSSSGSASVSITDASREALELGGLALETGGDALIESLQFGGDTVSDVLGFGGEALDFASDQNSGALDLVSDTVGDVFSLLGDVVEGVKDASSSAQRNVLDAANYAITAAEETTDERTSKAAIYAVAGVAAVMVMAMVMKK